MVMQAQYAWSGSMLRKHLNDFPAEYSIFILTGPHYEMAFNPLCLTLTAPEIFLLFSLSCSISETINLPGSGIHPAPDPARSSGRIGP